MEQNKLDKIELRSEKVQSIIGKVPPVIIRSGIAVLSIIFFILMAAMCMVPYPETVRVEAELQTTPCGQQIKMMLPYRLVSQTSYDTSVKVDFEGYDTSQFGSANAIVSNIDKKPVRINEINYFAIELTIKECSPRIQMHTGMKCYVSLLLSNKTLVQRIFSKLN